MEKNIFLLWLQGWEKAPWLQKKVLKSWQQNNQDWNVNLIDLRNLKDFVDDVGYIYDKTKKISFQATSDIIRLSLLKNHGGVWADSTLLCMQPLDHWSFEAVKESGIWMYHGHGAGLNSDLGPASWFILSEKNGYLIKKWKSACDFFWEKNDFTNNYFWMDSLFKNLIQENKKFKRIWLKTPYLYCEEFGSSHTLADYNNKVEDNSKQLKKFLRDKPPYVLKIPSHFASKFRDFNSKKYQDSNFAYALQISSRRFKFKHDFKKSESLISPYFYRSNFYINALRKTKIYLQKIIILIFDSLEKIFKS